MTIISAILLLYLALLIPDPAPDDPVIRDGKKPFAWNRDSLWNSLEAIFNEEKKADPVIRGARLRKLKRNAETIASLAENRWLPPNDTLFERLLNGFFELAPVIAAGESPDEWFTGYYCRVRNAVKLQSQRWDMNSDEARRAVYKLLYGMRAAMEEVLLQSPGEMFDPILLVKNEPSATRTTRIFGIHVHSGDLLVSRGGAVVSALISRGNDYPGNFSHVAMIYVDEKTGVPYLVEAHIERGVAVSTVAQYVADKKFRFMAMRLRTDLPQILRDPMIPRKAAAYIFRKALTSHIPYDFTMNFGDTSAMFCSEVCAAAYGQFGIRLWQAVSTISSPGTARLLHEFGVENFGTMMPSDLEYDPQLAVVAEWRDPRTLFKDHVYNAVMDVMLEKAENGKEIPVNLWMLPVARVVKAYSVILNHFQREGPIPEGMSATQGLKNNAFAEMHTRIRGRTEEKARIFISKNGYHPPYWQLVKMARESQ